MIDVQDLFGLNLHSAQFHYLFLNQAPSVHPLGKMLHQACVVQGTTVSLEPGHLHRKMEARQVKDVLKVITVPRAPQHHSPVPLDITPTKLETVTSLSACLVPQVGIDLVNAVYILVFHYKSFIYQKLR